MKVARFRDFRSLALLAAGRYPYPFLPQRARGALVDLAAAVETRVRPNRRRRIVRRLGATFRGDLPKHRIQNVARLAMRHETGEDISAWVVADAAAGLGVETEGLRHLQDALDRGKGVILWESPIGRRLLAKVALVARGLRHLPGPRPGPLELTDLAGTDHRPPDDPVGRVQAVL